MIPGAFEYHRPQSLDEAVTLLARRGDDAKILAGGHSLIPAMKLRLAQPAVLLDLGGLRELNYIRPAGSGFAIGAMTTHYDIESSAVLRDGCPLLTGVAPHIGDVQVRNKGTIGGSLVHADPASDWPAAILALDAELELAGPNGRRTVRAADFFLDLFHTAIASNEVLCEVRVPSTPKSVAYVKTRQQASGFALCGVAAIVEGPRARVGVTGVAAKPYRATAVEQAVGGQEFTPERIREAAARAADGVEPLGDLHASAEFRQHLARVNTARALTAAAAAAGRRH